MRECLSFELRRATLASGGIAAAAVAPSPSSSSSSSSSSFAVYLSTASPRLTRSARAALRAVEDAAEAAAEAQREEQERRRWAAAGGGNETSFCSSSSFAPALQTALDEARLAVGHLERAAEAAVGACSIGGNEALPSPSNRTELLSSLAAAVALTERGVARAAAARFVPIAYDLETTGLRIVDKSGSGASGNGSSNAGRSGNFFAAPSSSSSSPTSSSPPLPSSSNRDTITDIAALNLANPVAVFSTLCNIGEHRALPARVSELTGITREMVRDPALPSVPEAVASFVAFVEAQLGRGQSPLLVAHKGRSFDDPFVREELLESEGGWGAVAPSPPRHWHGLDTLLLVKTLERQVGSKRGSSASAAPLLPPGGSRSLQALREHYGLPEPASAHRALPDVLVLADVAKRLAVDAHAVLSASEGFAVDAFASSSSASAAAALDPVAVLSELAAGDVGVGSFVSANFGRNGAGDHALVFGARRRRGEREGGSGSEGEGDGGISTSRGSAAVSSATLRPASSVLPLPQQQQQFQQQQQQFAPPPPHPPPAAPLAAVPAAAAAEEEQPAFTPESAFAAVFEASSSSYDDSEQQNSTGQQNDNNNQNKSEEEREEEERAALASFMTPSLPDDAPSALRAAVASLSEETGSSSSSTFLAASDVPLAAVPAINAYWRRVLSAHGYSSLADLVGAPPKSYDSPAGDADENNGVSLLEPGSRVRLAGVVVGARTPPASFAARRRLVPYTVDVDVTDAIAERLKASSRNSSSNSSSSSLPMPRVILRVTRFAAGRAAYAIASKNSEATPLGSRVVIDGGVKHQQQSQQYRQWQRHVEAAAASSSSSQPSSISITFPPLVELDSSTEVLPAADPRVLGRGDVTPVYAGKTAPNLRPERIDELVCFALEAVRDPTTAAMMMSASETPRALPPPPFGAAVVGGAIPTPLSSALGLCPWSLAAVEVHAPKSLASASAARKRLAVEELVVMELAMEKMRRTGGGGGMSAASSAEEASSSSEEEVAEDDESESFSLSSSSPPTPGSYLVPSRAAAAAAAAALHFELTEGQRVALDEVLEDMELSSSGGGGGKEEEAMKTSGSSFDESFDDDAESSSSLASASSTSTSSTAGRPMSRLLQGDVGSGKSAVALVALLAAVGGGAQGALMAPTEVLAAQLHKGLETLISNLEIWGSSSSSSSSSSTSNSPPVFARRPVVALLTGSTKAAERRAVLQGAASGTIDVVVGTHALSSDAVTFKKLGLAVVDEQHRFGVLQRSALLAKADPAPHVLSMSATPIPRSLALVASGEAACSVVEGRPPGRGKVETFVVFDREQGREAVAERLRRDLAAGGRAFIVCPRVAEADEGTEGVVMVNEKSGNGSGSGSGSDGGGSSSTVEQQQQLLPELRAAEEEYNRLLETGALGKDVKVGLLHGRMKPAEKTAALDAFRTGETSVLISTSVVEVGVDVPEATAMVVEGADRFGLAQLHQLRGRVGRGGKDGVCVLMVRTERGAARLQPLVESDDGFRIAEADLKER